MIVIAALFLAACGGGGDGGTAPAPVVQPQAKTPVIMETYGDSTMKGMTRPDDVSPLTVSPTPAPSVLQAKLTAEDGSGITVSNQGVQSTTAFQLLYGKDGFHLAWEQQMAISQAKVIVINHAINDALGNGVSESLHDYQQVLSALVSVGQQAGKIVVLQEPNPVCIPDASTLDSYVNVMRTVAAQYNAPLIAQYDDIKAIPNWQKAVPDCVHPSDALYQYMGNRMDMVLAPIVSKLRG